MKQTLGIALALLMVSTVMAISLVSAQADVAKGIPVKAISKEKINPASIGHAKPFMVRTTGPSERVSPVAVLQAKKNTRATCTTDFDANTKIDTRDVIAFLNAWANKDMSADFDGNEEITEGDFTAFLAAWKNERANGC